ncbi:MAG: DnaD domain protein [Alkalicoccus sp.]|nr:MAG: DnaD domain protein [Alkalicoccus sp.]
MKRVVLKEELAAVTGDYKLAMVLNQMMYWALRTKSVSAFKKETVEGEKITYGWIYKSSEELAEEMMMNVSACSMRTYLKKLVEKGFLAERSNPVQKWDKTKQYRVLWRTVEKAAGDAGFKLEESWTSWKISGPDWPSYAPDEKIPASKPKKTEAVSETKAENTPKTVSILHAAYGKLFGKPGASVVKKLDDWTSSTFFQNGEAVVLYALEKAALYNARSFAYVEKMLQSWIDKGARTLEAVKELAERKIIAGMPKSTGKNTPYQEEERLLAKAEAAHWREVLHKKREKTYSRNR